ncbi:hypothetical protein JKY79_00330, partial [Candidatus Babeliales bacterium]|nr:hypothetical protein [Candidatus Babeliales bacterium]
MRGLFSINKILKIIHAKQNMLYMLFLLPFFSFHISLTAASETFKGTTSPGLKPLTAGERIEKRRNFARKPQSIKNDLEIESQNSDIFLDKIK